MNHQSYKISSKIAGHPGLVRPASGGGVINVNDDAYQQALIRLRNAKQKEQLEKRVAKMEATLDELLKRLGNEQAS